LWSELACERQQEAQVGLGDFENAYSSEKVIMADSDICRFGS
jgi:hypothetical protein